MDDTKMNRVIRDKALGFITSIEKMDGGQRVKFVTSAYAEDYNKLLQTAERENPEISDMLPPKIYVEGNNGYAPYGEIHTYCSQIYNMITQSG